jgi:murein L,D-transpeptidase YafK
MRGVNCLILVVLTGALGGAWADSTDKTVSASARVANVPGASSLGGAESPTSPAAHAFVAVPVPVADKVVVHKSERKLYLMRHGEVLRSYRVALGLQPEGAKLRAGDFRTPEGRYLLTRRNPRSDYFLSILVSYPNDQDQERARHDRVDPGGSIMIHGLPNSLRHSPNYYEKSDWTDGCIALSDSDMVEVWLMTRENTPIEILP